MLVYKQRGTDIKKNIHMLCISNNCTLIFGTRTLVPLVSYFNYKLKVCFVSLRNTISVSSSHIDFFIAYQ